MNALVNILESVGIFLAGLVVRFGILAAVLIGLAIVFLVGLAIVRGVQMLRRRVLGIGVADGLTWKRSGYYADGHTWVEPAATGTLRVGFDDLAQRVLGEVTALTLPKPGTRLTANGPLAEVQCGARRATIPSPISGEVVAANDVTVLQPGIVHHDPYRRGWLLLVKPADTAYTRLRWGSQASTWLREESARLRHAFEQHLQVHAADGGELAAPGHSLLDEEQWKALTRDFLKAL